MRSNRFSSGGNVFDIIYLVYVSIFNQLEHRELTVEEIPSHALGKILFNFVFVMEIDSKREMKWKRIYICIYVCAHARAFACEK